MNKTSLGRITLFALGAAVLLQFIMPFVYPIAGHDAAVHLNWLEQFPKLFREGNLYPRWMPDSFWGFGSPAFYFYPPLAYWCASLISFIFPSPVAMYQALGLIATFASIGTCYLYLRSLVESKRSAFIGALVYGVFPYRLIDLYLRNAIGEHVAFVFLPLILLSVELALRDSSDEKRRVLKSIIFSAIGWSGLLMANIPTAVIAIYSIPIYALIRSYSGRKYLKLSFPAVGAFIGLMIASVYFLPAVEFSSAIKLSHLWDLQVSEGNSGYAMLDIVYGRYRFFYIGLLITFAIGGWLTYKFYRIKKALNKGGIVSVFLVFLLIGVIVQIPYLLQPLINILPGFKLIQFSYRWDMLIVLAVAVYIALGFEHVNKTAVQCLICVASVVTIVIAIGYFTTMGGFHWQYRPMPGHMDAPEYITSAASGNIDVAKAAFKEHASDPLVISPVDSVHIRNIKSDANGLYFEVEGAHEKLPLLLHRMYFPALMRASLNIGDQQGGDELDVDSMGRIKLIVPPNRSGAFEWHSLFIRKSDAERMGEKVSLAGLLILGLLVLVTISLRNSKVS